MKPTLNQIRRFAPCAPGWTTALRALGKTQADDEPLPFAQILTMNTVEDAVWCLRAVPGYDNDIRKMAVACARLEEHLVTDQRCLNALNVAEQYADGLASEEAFLAASKLAWDAGMELKEHTHGAALVEAVTAIAVATRPDVYEAALVAVRGNDGVKAQREALFRQLCAKIDQE